MRVTLSALLLVLAAMGCQRPSEADLQNRVDSLQTVNRNMAAQLDRMRDSLRRRRSPSAEDGNRLVPPVYFPSGSAWLVDRAKEILDQHAQTIKQRYPNADFSVMGYTDNVPIGPSLKDTYPSNWYLSAQRAAAVAHYLDTEHGVETRTLEIEAFGPNAPAAPNETAQGRRENRRVEIVIGGGS